MQNTIIKVFITICLVLIMIPFVFVILKIKVDPVNKMEKKISLNFKRNFPLRSDLFKIYANYKHTFFQAEPIPYGVIDTKNGWKFLGNKFSNALSESKGLIVFTPLEIETLKSNLLAKKKMVRS